MALRVVVYRLFSGPDKIMPVGFDNTLLLVRFSIELVGFGVLWIAAGVEYGDFDLPFGVEPCNFTIDVVNLCKLII